VKRLFTRLSIIKKESIIKPPGLSPGDTIGVISPAGPVDESDLQPGIALLESSGFRVRLAPHVYEKRGYLAGEDEARLSDLHDMFRDKDIKAVFCTRGGYGCMRLLDDIDYELIKENPKIFVGYSDITALLMAIRKKTGLITFHGPMVRGLATKNQSNWESLLQTISSSQPLKLSFQEGTTLVAGTAKGKLIGGNLSMICHLVGTPYLPSLDGCILFVEERGEALYRLDRMLTHLRLSGQLTGLSGFIAGVFEECSDMSAIEDLLADILSGLNVPLATGLPVGHGLKNMTVPIGLPAILNTDSRTLSIMEAAVT
jgi:muramoyltetrapeptide carboxypeptidase